MKKIRKAVFPVTGFGEKQLAITKIIPVEMFPVLDQPLIQHAVDEARNAGIEECIFVTGRNRMIIEKYLELNGRPDDGKKRWPTSRIELASAPGLAAPMKTSFVRQRLFRGVGQDILCARELVGDEPFAVLVPTVLICSKTASIKQLSEQYEKAGGAVLAVEEVPAHRATWHGSIKSDSSTIGRISVTGPKDQPASEASPCNFATAGRYIFPPAIFQILEEQKKATGLQKPLTDAIRELAKTTSVSGHLLEGTAFDCSTPTGRVMANMFCALDNEAMKQELIEELVRTKMHSRIGQILDVDALAKLASTLQKVAEQGS